MKAIYASKILALSIFDSFQGAQICDSKCLGSCFQNFSDATGKLLALTFDRDYCCSGSDWCLDRSATFLFSSLQVVGDGRVPLDF